MTELLHALGIDGKLLLAQIGNFVILLIILRLTVYKPLINLMRKRRERIEHGLRGAEEADKRLAEIDDLKEEKLKEADNTALGIVSEAEATARIRQDQIISGAQDKADFLLKDAANIARQKQSEELGAVHKEAQKFVRDAIERTCELDPASIDEKLIAQAVKEIKQGV